MPQSSLHVMCTQTTRARFLQADLLPFLHVGKIVGFNLYLGISSPA